MRLPHFVKTSCGTPSRGLFRFGLPPEASQTRRVVGAAGFEPTLTESESGVLPLNYDYAPMWGLLYIVCVCFAIYFFIYGWGAFNMDNIAAHGRMLGYLKIPYRLGASVINQDYPMVGGAHLVDFLTPRPPCP